MEYLYILLLFLVLFENSFTKFVCHSMCSDQDMCKLSRLNTTCLMMETGSCIQGKKREKGVSPPSYIQVRSDRKAWIISWKPPTANSHNYDNNYNGFIITIGTEEPEIFIYYMKTLSENYNKKLEAYEMNCSYTKDQTYIPDVSETCVQSLPESMFVGISPDRQRICRTPFKYRYFTDAAASHRNSTILTATSVTIMGMITDRSNFKEHRQIFVIIGTVSASVLFVTCIIVTVALYRHCRSNIHRKKELKAYPAVLSTDLETRNSTPECPVHGIRDKHESVSRSTCNVTEYQTDIQLPISQNVCTDMSFQEHLNDKYFHTMFEDNNKKNIATHPDVLEEKDHQLLKRISESDQKLFDINFN